MIRSGLNILKRSHFTYRPIMRFSSDQEPPKGMIFCYIIIKFDQVLKNFKEKNRNQRILKKSQSKKYLPKNSQLNKQLNKRSKT